MPSFYRDPVHVPSTIKKTSKPQMHSVKTYCLALTPPGQAAARRTSFTTADQSQVPVPASVPPEGTERRRFFP